MKSKRPKVLGLIVLGLFLSLTHMDRTAEAFLKPGNGEGEPRIIVVLVDMSGSTNLARRTIYKEGFEKIFQDLGQGDRIMVGTITGRSYIDFQPVVDVEIPRKSLWLNRIRFERNLTDTKESVRTAVEDLFARRKGTPRTEILNSLNIADTIFHGDKRRHRILVLFSDMIQDSREYNFSRVEVTDAYVGKVIRYREKHNMIPNLANVKVYVAGASGADPNKFRSVERFWARYFEKTGAAFSPHRYGHSLISFEGKL